MFYKPFFMIISISTQGYDLMEGEEYAKVSRGGRCGTWQTRRAENVQIGEQPEREVARKAPRGAAPGCLHGSHSQPHCHPSEPALPCSGPPLLHLMILFKMCLLHFPIVGICRILFLLLKASYPFPSDASAMHIPRY